MGSPQDDAQTFDTVVASPTPVPEIYAPTREQLPIFPAEAKARIYYVEAPLAAAPRLARFMRQFHSALTVYMESDTKSIPREMTFGYEAKDGMYGAVLPTNFSGEVPTWDNL